MYDDKNDWVENIRSRGTWARGLFMVLFAAVLWFSRILLFVMAVVQFASVLIAGRPVAGLLPFGRGLSAYMRDIGLYLSWNSDKIPWPGSPWPAGDDIGEDDYREDDPGAHGAPPAEPAPPFDPGPVEAEPIEEAPETNDAGDTPEEPPRPDA
jgi:hypothetical protein